MVTKKIPAKSVIKSTTHTPTKKTVIKSTTHTPTKKKANTAGVIKSTTHTPTKKKTANGVIKSTTHTPTKKKAPATAASSAKKGTPVNFSDSNTKKKAQATNKKPSATKSSNTNNKNIKANKSATPAASASRSKSSASNNNRSTPRGNSLDISNKSNGSQRSSRLFNNRTQSYRRRPSSRSYRTPQEQEELIIRDLLGDGAYHLPGNNWRQDWVQYLVNTHPVFSICCQHRLHPISRWMRAVALLGSIMIGLVITNIIYLLVIHDQDEQFQIIELPNGDLAVADEDGDGEDSNTFVIVPHENESEILKEYTHPELDSGMLILWTVGSAVHAIWDNTIWYLTSCACIDQSSEEAQQDDEKKQMITKAKKACNILVVIGCIVITAAATLAVIIRAHVEGGGEVEDVDVGSFSGNSLVGESISNKENYEFLISYGVELFVAWFLWFPIIETFLFSGIMGLCFPCVSCLAGRPGEVKEEEANNNNNASNADIEAAARRRRRGRGGKTRGCCW